MIFGKYTLGITRKNEKMTKHFIKQIIHKNGHFNFELGYLLLKKYSIVRYELQIHYTIELFGKWPTMGIGTFV
jgi:hypothetical protein